MTLFTSNGELYHGSDADLAYAITSTFEDNTIIDATDYGIESPEELEPRQTCFIIPYPGETAFEAVARLRRRYPACCIRRDGSNIAYHGTRLRRGGRLRAWTGLKKGQALCWGMNPEQAVRIAQWLERRGLGRFIVFEDAYMTWVHRMG